MTPPTELDQQHDLRPDLHPVTAEVEHDEPTAPTKDTVWQAI